MLVRGFSELPDSTLASGRLAGGIDLELLIVNPVFDAAAVDLQDLIASLEAPGLEGCGTKAIDEQAFSYFDQAEGPAPCIVWIAALESDVCVPILDAGHEPA